MRPLTSVLTVSMLTTIKDFTIQRRDVNYSLNSIRLLRIVITPSTRTSLKKLIWILSVFIAIIPTHFVKCRRTFLELNSQGPYPSSKTEIKFRRCLFTSSIKREISHFKVVVVQKRAKKCTKNRDARARLLFCLLKPIVFFDVLVAVRVVGS